MTVTNFEFLDWLYKDHTPPDGKTWNGWAGSLLYRAGLAPARANIRALIREAGPLNTDRTAAPPMAIHFFHIGANDNAVVDHQGGGKTAIGVGPWVTPFGDGIGNWTLDKYNGDYLGWTTSDVLLALDAPVVHGES